MDDARPRADPFALGRLARALPEAVYRIDGELPDARLAALGWVLESYRFDAIASLAPRRHSLYARTGSTAARSCPPPSAHYLVRDLVNTPSSDMGPDELEAAARNGSPGSTARNSETVAGNALWSATFR